MTSYVVLDQSGSMYNRWANAKVIAQALLSLASPENRVGFITFHDQVHLQNYFSNSPTPLLGSLARIGGPFGVTELVDALVTAVVIDTQKPDTIYLISDGGENASETPEQSCAYLSSIRGVQIIKLVPPVSQVLVPPWIAALERRPIFRFEEKLKDVRPVDLSAITEPEKLIAAMEEIRAGKLEKYVAAPVPVVPGPKPGVRA